jgi:hypothetical protein
MPEWYEPIQLYIAAAIVIDVLMMIVSKMMLMV